MIGVIRTWLAQRKFRRVAKAVIASPESDDLARAWANATIAALQEGRSLCGHCMNPFVWHKRPWEDEFVLRSILMIPDSAPMPMMCDSCFETAIAAYNKQATNVGTRNDGHANLVLRQFG
jgi:hypothetical protein